MEKNYLKITQRDYLQFFELPVTENHVLNVKMPKPENHPCGPRFGIARPGYGVNTLQDTFTQVEIKAPEEVQKMQDNAFRIEYLGNAEALFYNGELLAGMLFSVKAHLYRPVGTAFQLVFQDYRQPLALNGEYCNIESPLFSFLTIAESLGIADIDLIRYGVLVYKGR